MRASDAERLRIARDLHDGVVQGLAGSSMALSTLSARSDGAMSGELDAAVQDRVAPPAHFGLRAAESLVREHRGTMEVESAPGSGTVVRVEVPLACPVWCSLTTTPSYAVGWQDSSSPPTTSRWSASPRTGARPWPTCASTVRTWP